MAGMADTKATLTEFLLARIAEDEERAEFVRRENEKSSFPPLEPWRLSWHDEYDLLCIEPVRALAECQAKRGIIAMHPPVTVEEHYHAPRATRARDLICAYDSDPDGLIDATNEWPCATVRHLAAVYADHPDYDPAWRVDG